MNGEQRGKEQRDLSSRSFPCVIQAAAAAQSSRKVTFREGDTLPPCQYAAKNEEKCNASIVIGRDGFVPHTLQERNRLALGCLMVAEEAEGMPSADYLCDTTQPYGAEDLLWWAPFPEDI